MLDPSLPAPGTNKMALYRKKFGARFDAMIPHMKQVGSTIGVNFSYGGNVGNTLNSHRLVTWAQKQGADAEDKVRLRVWRQIRRRPIGTITRFTPHSFFISK